MTRHVRVPIGLSLALSVIIAFQVGYARVLDPHVQSPEREVLLQVAPQLDVEGIDTVYGETSKIPLTNSPVRVAPLAGYRPLDKHDWGRFFAESWMDAFKKGIIGFLAVVPNNGSELSDKNKQCIEDIRSLGKDVCDFVAKWISSPKDRRIFIAFTKDDFESAQKVKLAFEKSGFAVFLFLKGKEDKPWADPAMAGEVFAQANVRLVIDTINARGSAGVAMERECCAPLLLGPPPPTPLSQALQTGGK